MNIMWGLLEMKYELKRQTYYSQVAFSLGEKTVQKPH